MTDRDDKYRQYAQEAQTQADRAILERDKASWLKIAQSWLEMLPKRHRSPQEEFDDRVRERSTGQEGSEASN